MVIVSIDNMVDVIAFRDGDLFMDMFHGFVFMESGACVPLYLVAPGRPLVKK